MTAILNAVWVITGTGPCAGDEIQRTAKPAVRDGWRWVRLHMRADPRWYPEQLVFAGHGAGHEAQSVWEEAGRLARVAGATPYEAASVVVRGRRGETTPDGSAPASSDGWEPG